MTDDEGAVVRQLDALERVTDGVVVLDANFRYAYVNRRAEGILGKDRDELLGERLWDAFPETIGTVTQEELEGTMRTRRRTSFERYNRRLGQWFEIDVYPDEEGISIFFTDVSERKRFERDLDQTTRQLESLVENTSEAIYIKDSEGRYRLMNEAAAEFFGLTPEEAIGKHDGALFDPESATGIREVDTQVVERGEPRTREAIQYIDGEEHVFLDNKFPYRDEEGEIIGVMGLSREITERKRHERELRALNEEYEALIENADDAIFLVDVAETDADIEFRFERLSPSHEAASGLSTEEIRGKTPREALGDDAGAEVEANYRRCVEAREPITYEEELPMPEGRIVWQTKLAPVVVDDEVTRIVGIARDVTDRVDQERELRRKNDRLDEFARVISHDLRNPLNVVQALTTHLDEEYESEHLPVISEALDRMEAIIEHTLTLAREERTVVEPTQVEGRAHVDQCWEMVDTAGATLVVDDEFTLVGDPDRLRHVFENLFRNAVEHGGPDVTVRVGRIGERGIYVEDDGPGIPEDEREAVFEPGHTSATGGTGFGLAIVRRIAEAHGWTVTATESDGGGARFEFTGVTVAPQSDPA